MNIYIRLRVGELVEFSTFNGNLFGGMKVIVFFL